MSAQGEPVGPVLGSAASPSAGSERHDVLDALRGFALFGIFLANIRVFSGWEFIGPVARSELAGNSYVIWDFLHLAVIDGKFYTLFAFLFYGIGLNQAGLWPIQALVAFACAVYAAQVVFSHLWLKSFQYGPMEWLWRALTYGSAPKLPRSMPT